MIRGVLSFDSCLHVIAEVKEKDVYMSWGFKK
jgi:hypothetical protein